MTRRIRGWWLAALATAALAGACGGSSEAGGDAEGGGEESTGGEGSSYSRAELDAAMESGGATVRVMGQVHQPFFSVPGTRLALEGGGIAGMQEIQVFEYPSEADARLESDVITPDGTATVNITWIDDPHFFRRGRLTVIYVGSDAATMAMLERELGAQFAGR